MDMFGDTTKANIQSKDQNVRIVNRIPNKSRYPGKICFEKFSQNFRQIMHKKFRNFTTSGLGTDA